MAWTEADRVKIRAALGFGALFLQAYPLLEQAMTAVQSTADGGNRPDNSTELHIRGLLTDLDDVFATLKKFRKRAHAVEVGGGASAVKVDMARGMALERQEGRRIIKGLEVALSTAKKADIFSPGGLDTGVPFDISGAAGTRE